MNFLQQQLQSLQQQLDQLQSSRQSLENQNLAVAMLEELEELSKSTMNNAGP